MDIAYELAQYLDDAGFGTLGTDIFSGQIPSDTNGLYVLRTGGELDNYLPVEDSMVDIYCKNTSALECVGQLENIKRFIHRMHNTVTSGAYIYSMLVISDVEDIERDMEYAKIYKFTVSIKHRSLGLIS